MTNNKLAIQIICYRSKNILQEYLPDLFRQLKYAQVNNYEIHILDNGSNDGLRSFAKKMKNSKVFFYFSKKNLGFGCGHNFLSTKSESDYILITNADLHFLEKDTISKLINILDKSPHASAVAPKLLNTNLKPLPFDSTCLVNKNNPEILHPLEFFYWKNVTDFSEMAMVAASFVLIRRKDFKAVQGFDKNIFLYLEDADLCFKLRKIGRHILYDPTIYMVHESKFNKSKYSCYYESLFYLLDKYFKNNWMAFFIKASFKLLPIYQIRKLLKPEPFNNNLK